jgi:tyrosinase
MPLTIRREIHNIQGNDLIRFRRAFQSLKDTSGSDGYLRIAGVHGIPDRQCLHHVSGWLPWHRAYLLKIEHALQVIDPGVSLPFWDWTSDIAVQEGLPLAFSDPTYSLPDGTLLPNPLVSATYTENGNQHSTSRHVGSLSIRRQVANEVAGVYDATVFDAFSHIDTVGHESLAAPHDDLHSSWVRGSMGDPRYSAYDPIFWAHHANVDRIWAQWQIGRNNADPDAGTQGMILDPFGVSVGSLLNFENTLGYTYEGLTPMPPTFVSQPVYSALPIGTGGRFHVAHFRFNPLRDRVFLHVNGIAMDSEPFQLDVFVGQPTANTATAIDDNPHYAGTIGIFSAPHPMHQHHPSMHSFNRKLDISNTLAIYTRTSDHAELKLVARDMSGNPIDFADLSIGNITLVIE